MLIAAVSGVLWLFTPLVQAAVNSAPQFLPGGDMSRFALLEDSQVGAPVYRLQGIDPEGSPVHYSISGQHFQVDRISGIVSLVKPLDREVEDILEVIISITDESVGGAEPNTVSLRREIPVLDVNDNSPEFLGRPYSVVLMENTKPGSEVFSNITVVDADSGHNAEITLSCISGGCDTFSITTEKISEGNYKGVLVLKKALDFEQVSSYSLSLRASDNNKDKPLHAMATIAISVKDIQDQPPVFLNAPYSATLQENTSPGYQVLQVKAKDGDLGDSRTVILSLEGDELGYFKMSRNNLITSHVPIDREHPLILQNGGVYTFDVVATELINNELPGDFSHERVTIVITDVDDQIPKFNERYFNINVSEDIGLGTPLPGLNMVVSDDDLGENAHYTLQLKSQDRRAVQWFMVEPESAYGRTPVVVRLKDNTSFDFDTGVKQVQFTISALVQTKQGESFEVSSSEVVVNILDANDNSPIFNQSSYSFTIPENFTVGSMIANITASDIDSGEFGTITYSLRGFGTNKFSTNPKTGNLYLSNKVDYEKQKSYSLSLEAKDGGGRVSTVAVLVTLTDVNDNPPIWEMPQYQRTVREGATSFQPQFFIRALDADKDNESKLRYKILTSNSDVLGLNENTGEILILSPVSSEHTSRGQYELMIRAFDDGVPPFHADVPVFIRVGVPGNQRPVFRGVPYNVTLPETAKEGDVLVTVRATDPDGPNSAVHYKLSNGADNFQINQSSGVITVAKAAILDPDVTKTMRYAVTVLAVDSGAPIRETAQTTVTVNILDINNKAPYFLPDSNYVRHISEKSDIGKTVVMVKAIDSDHDADIEYSIIDVRAMHKTGVPVLKGSAYDFEHAFVINSSTGEIKVNSHLSHQAAAVIILKVGAKDKNAVVNPDNQRTEVEVTLYIQAYDEQNPKFTVGGWTPFEPIINISFQEEKPAGSPIFTLSGIDPTNNFPLTRFSLIPPIPPSISMDSGGSIVTLKKIDYESMLDKTISFRVEATSADGQRSSIAQVHLNIEDINDNTPQFEKTHYKGQIYESAAKGTIVLNVKAVDGDEFNTTLGYGDIKYSLSGENAALFSIDPNSGTITVSGNGTIDREKQDTMQLVAFAADTPQGGANQRRSSVPIVIEVLDINDNKPLFEMEEYSAVVLENVLQGTSVLNISAIDFDSGAWGLVEYEIVDQPEAAGLFKINKTTGEIVTNMPLTGKGRAESYVITARALDHGEPSLFSDVPVRIFIGDVVTNDGIPMFLHPTLNEMAYISEDSAIGSPVFRVTASDPDNPNSLEGQVRFSFLPDETDSQAFSIDSVTGLITTKQHLDREIKSNYTLILVAQDSGMVPQHATRQLHISVTDVDDNKPLFKRSIDDDPVEFTIKEELPEGTEVGVIRAEDDDVGDNAKIGYLITCMDLYHKSLSLSIFFSCKYKMKCFLLDLKVYVVRDRGLLKFVFSQPPGEVRANLAEFKKDVEQTLALPASLNIYDTLFLSKKDGSLDFSATISCFQLVGAHMFDVKETEKLMSPQNNPDIAEIYRKYNVQGVERCAPQIAHAEVTWVQLCVLGIAAFIGIASMISGCVLCCSYKKWHRIR
ncbi:cadherin-23-like [Cimex lectularius]|uniref:Cadherin domain-containing protein n=1 Tax=Cimex lectularius TaxID=79782 RepID=A0A8I6SRG0_CIMLE|nr:cadherin-23-like [Cimex lectularius]